jgi:hypothetical protein
MSPRTAERLVNFAILVLVLALAAAAALAVGWRSEALALRTQAKPPGCATPVAPMPRGVNLKRFT